MKQIQKTIAEDAQIRQKRAEQEAVLAQLALLTPRELEVIDLVIAGESNKVIASQLGISTKTIEFHRSHIMKKMKVNSVAELVALVISAAKEQPI